MKEKQRTYIAIDLKSFYASVECVERGLDPMTTNLVVADTSRTDKTICLAVSPTLKQYGIGGRARLFEVVQRVRQLNRERQLRAPGGRLVGTSFSDPELQAHPDWAIGYVAAPPQMAHYIDVSTRIYGIYLKYVSTDDIHVYSIDEVFMDVTGYLDTYHTTAHELAMRMVRDVLATTGITATAGIGTNLYLAKVAMDIVAKKMPADSDGVRVAELDEMAYRRQLWDHRPLTAFWRVGRGVARRLAAYGLDTMGKVARQSVQGEELLYRLFGVNAELLIDHAWGWEPCTIADIKAYRPETNSLSRGQVLQSPYDAARARVVVMEMAEGVALKLVERRMVAGQLTVSVGYDTENLATADRRDAYAGEVAIDHYGRSVPRPAHASMRFDEPTSSSRRIMEGAAELFDSIADRRLTVRRLGVTVGLVVPEAEAARRAEPVQLELFVDNEALDLEKRRQQERRDKERRMQEAQLRIKQRFGKNSILRGLNFEDGATARSRNEQIGGHKA